MGGNIILKIDTATTDINDDRLSELPDVIAHNILSYLVNYPAELIRMSVVSKRWFALTASFPIMVFNVEVFTRAKYRQPGFPYDREHAKEIFFNYVGYTTSRFSQQQTVVGGNTFYLFAKLEDPVHARIIDRCLELILKQGLQVFSIFSTGRYPYSVSPPMYRLPDKLLSVSSLTSLSIHYCELPSSLMAADDDKIVKFKSLKVLYLDGVYLNEEMIKCLTDGCPLLEKFNVYRCYGFKRLCVRGHQNLQNVGVHYTSAVEEIDIQAPNLAYINLFHIDLYHLSERDKPPCVNFFSCQKLSMIHNGYFSKLFAVTLSNFPFLETLSLKLQYRYKNFNLSSHSLRKLSLDTLTGLDEIKIDTPNLLYLQYYNNRWCTGHQSIRDSGRHRPAMDSGESKTCMRCSPDFGTDASWFQEFRRFLDRTIRFKVLRLHIFANFIDVEELKLLESSPFELEHIELEVFGARELSKHLSDRGCCSLVLPSSIFNFRITFSG